jgi:hypothetical protein
VIIQSLLWLLVMLAVFDIGRIQRRIAHAKNREVNVIGDQVSPALSFATGGDQ